MNMSAVIICVALISQCLSLENEASNTASRMEQTFDRTIDTGKAARVKESGSGPNSISQHSALLSVAALRGGRLKPLGLTEEKDQEQLSGEQVSTAQDGKVHSQKHIEAALLTKANSSGQDSYAEAQQAKNSSGNTILQEESNLMLESYSQPENSTENSTVHLGQTAAKQNEFLQPVNHSEESTGNRVSLNQHEADSVLEVEDRSEQNQSANNGISSSKKISGNTILKEDTLLPEMNLNSNSSTDDSARQSEQAVARQGVLLLPTQVKVEALHKGQTPAEEVEADQPGSRPSTNNTAEKRVGEVGNSSEKSVNSEDNAGHNMDLATKINAEQNEHSPHEETQHYGYEEQDIVHEGGRQLPGILSGILSVGSNMAGAAVTAGMNVASAVLSPFKALSHGFTIQWNGFADHSAGQSEQAAAQQDWLQQPVNHNGGRAQMESGVRTRNSISTNLDGGDSVRTGSEDTLLPETNFDWTSFADGTTWNTEQTAAKQDVLLQHDNEVSTLTDSGVQKGNSVSINQHEEDKLLEVKNPSDHNIMGNNGTPLLENSSGWTNDKEKNTMLPKTNFNSNHFTDDSVGRPEEAAAKQDVLPPAVNHNEESTLMDSNVQKGNNVSINQHKEYKVLKVGYRSEHDLTTKKITSSSEKSSGWITGKEEHAMIPETNSSSNKFTDDNAGRLEKAAVIQGVLPQPVINKEKTTLMDSGDQTGNSVNTNHHEKNKVLEVENCSEQNLTTKKITSSSEKILGWTTGIENITMIPETNSNLNNTTDGSAERPEEADVKQDVHPQSVNNNKESTLTDSVVQKRNNVSITHHKEDKLLGVENRSEQNQTGNDRTSKKSSGWPSGKENITMLPETNSNPKNFTHDSAGRPEVAAIKRDVLPQPVNHNEESTLMDSDVQKRNNVIVNQHEEYKVLEVEYRSEQNQKANNGSSSLEKNTGWNTSKDNNTMLPGTNFNPNNFTDGSAGRPEGAAVKRDVLPLPVYQSEKSSLKDSDVQKRNVSINQHEEDKVLKVEYRSDQNQTRNNGTSMKSSGWPSGKENITMLPETNFNPRNFTHDSAGRPEVAAIKRDVLPQPVNHNEESTLMDSDVQKRNNVIVNQHEEYKVLEVEYRSEQNQKANNGSSSSEKNTGWNTSKDNNTMLPGTNFNPNNFTDGSAGRPEEAVVKQDVHPQSVNNNKESTLTDSVVQKGNNISTNQHEKYKIPEVEYRSEQNQTGNNGTSKKSSGWPSGKENITMLPETNFNPRNFTHDSAGRPQKAAMKRDVLPQSVNHDEESTLMDSDVQKRNNVSINQHKEDKLLEVENRSDQNLTTKIITSSSEKSSEWITGKENSTMLLETNSNSINSTDAGRPEEVAVKQDVLLQPVDHNEESSDVKTENSTNHRDENKVLEVENRFEQNQTSSHGFYSWQKGSENTLRKEDTNSNSKNFTDDSAGLPTKTAEKHDVLPQPTIKASDKMAHQGQISGLEVKAQSGSSPSTNNTAGVVDVGNSSGTAVDQEDNAGHNMDLATKIIAEQNKLSPHNELQQASNRSEGQDIVHEGGRELPGILSGILSVGTDIAGVAVAAGMNVANVVISPLETISRKLIINGKQSSLKTGIIQTIVNLVTATLTKVLAVVGVSCFPIPAQDLQFKGGMLHKLILSESQFCGLSNLYSTNNVTITQDTSSLFEVILPFKVDNVFISFNSAEAHGMGSRLFEMPMHVSMDSVIVSCEIQFTPGLLFRFLSIKLKVNDIVGLKAKFVGEKLPMMVQMATQLIPSCRAMIIEQCNAKLEEVQQKIAQILFPGFPLSMG